jgi:hypothetical protein
MTFNSQALTIPEENTKNLMENWCQFSNYGTGSLERIFQNVIGLYGGVDCNYRDKNGNAILHIAAANGDIDVVKLLILKLNASLLARNNANQTPLSIAKKNLKETIDSISEYQNKKVPRFIIIYHRKCIEVVNFLTESLKSEKHHDNSRVHCNANKSCGTYNSMRNKQTKTSRIKRRH